MIAQLRRFNLRRSCVVLCFLVVQAHVPHESAWAINIKVEYLYDENSPTPFFNTQQKKDALLAAANRFSGIITESLLVSTLSNGSTNDPRISFTHPVSGAMNFQVSSAASAASDYLVTNAGAAVANEYRGSWSIAANDWILYAGGRSFGMGIAAEASTGSGTNLTSVFASGSSHLNRGFRSSGSHLNKNLPMWGGAISFDNDSSTDWHYNHTTTPPVGSVDFYSVALHEIGHLLGLSAEWDEWTSKQSGAQFNGAQAVARYNQDNGTSRTFLNQESASNRHWDDGAYNSYIFQNAGPNLVGTAGTGVPQDLIMEPTAHFTPSVRRFEMTNVDVAALVDIGWSVVPQINIYPGDYNRDGIVDAADYVVWGKGLADGNYSTWRTNFGDSFGSGGGGLAGEWASGLAIPEPSSIALLAIASVALCWSRHRNASSRG